MNFIAGLKRNLLYFKIKTLDEKIRIQKWTLKGKTYPRTLFLPFLKAHFKINDLSSNPYTLYFVKNGRTGWGRRGKIFSKVYFDASYGFVLAKRYPLAYLTFDIQENIIFVVQIQGIKGVTKDLQVFRWEKMLLRITMDWAKRNGYSEVRVQSAEKNEWRREDHAKIFKIRYDTTAKRCGLKLDDDRAYYSIKLTKPTS